MLNLDDMSKYTATLNRVEKGPCRVILQVLCFSLWAVFSSQFGDASGMSSPTLYQLSYRANL